MPVIAPPPPRTAKPLGQRIAFGIVFAVLAAGAAFYALTFVNLLLRTAAGGGRFSTLDAGFRTVALPVSLAAALLVFAVTVRRR